MALRRPPGASWAPGRPQEADGRPTEGPRKALGAVLGPSWGRLGASWDRFGPLPPSGEGSGRAFLEVFWDVRRGSLKKIICSICLMCFGVYFYPMFGPLLPSFLRARRRREHGHISTTHFFCGSQAICAFFAQRAKRVNFRENA